MITFLPRKGTYIKQYCITPLREGNAVLGSGGFGSVYSVKNVHTNEFAAMKLRLRHNDDHRDYWILFKREIEVVSCLHF